MERKRTASRLPPGTGTAVVEMETAAVVRTACPHDIPVMGVRAISDPLDDELGFNLEEFCDEQKVIRPMRVLACIARKPSLIPQLLRLASNSRLAAANLAREVATIIRLR